MKPDEAADRKMAIAERGLKRAVAVLANRADNKPEAPRKRPKKGPKKDAVHTPALLDAEAPAAPGEPGGDAGSASSSVPVKRNNKGECHSIFEKLKVVDYEIALPSTVISRYQITANQFPQTVGNKCEVGRWKRQAVLNRWRSLPLHIQKKHKDVPPKYRRVLTLKDKGSRPSLPDSVLVEFDKELCGRIKDHALSTCVTFACLCVQHINLAHTHVGT